MASACFCIVAADNLRENIELNIKSEYEESSDLHPLKRSKMTVIAKWSFVKHNILILLAIDYSGLFAPGRISPPE